MELSNAGIAAPLPSLLAKDSDTTEKMSLNQGYHCGGSARLGGSGQQRLAPPGTPAEARFFVFAGSRRASPEPTLAAAAWSERPSSAGLANCRFERENRAWLTAAPRRDQFQTELTG
jgi:hypothetical protein